MEYPSVKRALLSLEGLAHGDAFGELLQEHYLGGNTAGFRAAVSARAVPVEVERWFWTDDTAMALGVVEALLRWGTLRGECGDEVDSDDALCGQRGLARIFARNASRLGPRQYSCATADMLAALDATHGAGWRQLSERACSKGNGSAMRIAPLGAFFADSMPERIVEEATLATTVTHTHPEAVDGACAVALAAACIARNPAAVLPRDVLEHALAPLPQTSSVRALCSRIACDGAAPLSLDFAEAASVLGNGEPPTCCNTVPFALWSACKFLHERASNKLDFEGLMWGVASAGGDVDTNCAIVGGIVAAAAGPVQLAPWLSLREPLITVDWPPLPNDLWPLGPPRTGRGLHPFLMTIRF